MSLIIDDPKPVTKRGRKKSDKEKYEARLKDEIKQLEKVREACKSTKERK